MGAILAYMGVHGCVPLVHGSQGCSTYPRYNIARHFRESAEVAVSSLAEDAAVYGGARNLTEAIKNVKSRINPGDISEIKNMLRIMNVNSIFLSDISETLDTPILPGGHKPLLPDGGTEMSEIVDSANSLGTIFP